MILRDGVHGLSFCVRRVGPDRILRGRWREETRIWVCREGPPEHPALCRIVGGGQNVSVTSPDPFRVIFVCTGHICRSPWPRSSSATSPSGRDSARVSSRAAPAPATGIWASAPTTARSTPSLRRGYSTALGTSARQFTAAAFADNDLVVALDRTPRAHPAGVGARRGRGGQGHAAPRVRPGRLHP